MDKLNCFSLTTNDHVAHLVLNKPESLNTMHPTFWRELDTVLHQLNDAGQARALVISSTGKHFSAGMALETFSGAISMDADSAEGRAAIYDSLTDMQSTFTLLESMRIPVIAAIQGGCIGVRSTWSQLAAFAMPRKTRFSVFKKSTLAWWPMWALCSVCPNCCPWVWSKNWPTLAAA